MELPLVEEIREARRLTEETWHASVLVAQARAVLTSVQIYEDLSLPTGYEPDLPGENIVDAATERWSQLADLHSSDPRPGDPLEVQLEARRHQMQAAIQELGPLADSYHHHSHQLGHLQKEQGVLLEHPRYAEEVVELRALGVERTQLERELGPVRERLGVLLPAGSVLGAFAERVDSELEQLRMIEDPTGISTWKALAVCESLAGTASETLESLGLKIAPPRGPSLEDGAPREAALVEIERVLGEFRGLLRSMDPERESLEAEDERVSARLDAIRSHLLERLG